MTLICFGNPREAKCSILVFHILFKKFEIHSKSTPIRKTNNFSSTIMDERAHDPINFKILKNPDAREFIDELHNASLDLDPETAPKFFKVIMANFDKQIDPDKGKEILHTLCRVLSTESLLKIFVRKQFPKYLPFQPKEYINDLFDLLYVIVTRCPEAFDKDLCSGFMKRIKYRGEKSLVIIRIFSQHFDEVDDPWPMLDLLFQCADRFTKQDLVSQYANLLSILVQVYPEFRRERGELSWNVISGLLTEFPVNEEHIPILKTLYTSLSNMADTLRKVEIPAEAIKEHIQNDYLAESVTSLLNNLPIHKYRELANSLFLKCLLKRAINNNSAMQALMRLAENAAVAKLLVRDPTWLNRELPSFEDTLSLLVVVFKHVEIRDKLARTLEFTEVLEKMVQTDEIDLACKLVRKLDLTEDIIRDLLGSSFITLLLDIYDGDDQINKAILLLIKKLTESCLEEQAFIEKPPKELVYACTFVEMILRNYKFDDPKTADMHYLAAKVATKLGNYTKCARKFYDDHVISDFQKKLKNPDYAPIAKKFLKSPGVYKFKDH